MAVAQTCDDGSCGHDGCVTAARAAGTHVEPVSRSNYSADEPKVVKYVADRIVAGGNITKKFVGFKDKSVLDQGLGRPARRIPIAFPPARCYSEHDAAIPTPKDSLLPTMRDHTGLTPGEKGERPMTKATLVNALLFSVALLIPTQSAGQSWRWVHPKPSGARMGNIQFVSATEGWMSSEGGLLFHTLDGGTTWDPVAPAPGIGFQVFSDVGSSMIMANATTGWLIGTYGGSETATGIALYKTTDGGTTWNPDSIGADTIGVSIEFADANTGWAATARGDLSVLIKSSIYATSDGGATWGLQYAAPDNNVVTSISSIDALNAWALQDSFDTQAAQDPLSCPCRILHTSDGGATWSTVWTDTTAGSINAIQAVDASNIWAVGDTAKVMKSTDGGSTWVNVSIPGIDPGSFNRGLFFIDANIGWIAGASTAGTWVFHTTDGGTTWNTVSTPTLGMALSLFFVDASNGWYAGELGAVARTTDGGNTWQPQNTRLIRESPLTDVFFVNSMDGWAVGDTILHTVDGGCQWLIEPSFTGGGLAAVWGAAANDVIAVGNIGFLYRYDGVTWAPEPESQVVTSQDLHAVWGSSASDVFAVGNAGTILRFNGTSWSADPQSGSIVTANLRDVWGSSPTDVIAVGDGGTIIRFNGTNWSVDPASGVATVENLLGLWGSASNDVYAVGGGGVALHYNGSGWNQLVSADVRLNDVSGSSANEVLIVGREGNVFRYDGVSWSVEPTGAGDLKSVAFAGPGKAIITDDTAGILVTPVTGPSCDVVSVAIVAFDATPVPQGVKLSWEIGNANGLAGFNIYRSTGTGVGFHRINPSLIPGYAGSAYVDDAVTAGRTYTYRLGAVDRDGEVYSFPVSVSIPLRATTLGQNHPNPFNPETAISFYLATSADVDVSVYDAQGKRVATLVHERRNGGPHTVTWDGKNARGNTVSSGLYFYRLKTGRTVLTRKLVLLK